MAGLGDFRHRVVIQRNTTTPDGKGGRTSSWGTLATVWAQVTPTRGNERQMAGAMTSEVAYRIRTRLRTDITIAPKDRLVWDSKTLQIHAVTNEGGLDRFWLLDCGEAA